jgi:hypothetical protein
MIKLLQKRLDLVFIAIVSSYIYSNHGDKPQVAALFSALKYIFTAYLLKNTIVPSKDFYVKWVKTLKEYDFETTPETLRLVVSFMTFAFIIYQVVQKIYILAKP